MKLDALNAFRSRCCVSLADNCSGVCWRGSQARGRLECTCGCQDFFLFKRKKSSEEELEEIEAFNRLRLDYWPFVPVVAVDKDGRTVVRNEFFGIKWKERPFSEYAPSVVSFQFVAAKCKKCGKEIVLFDERCCPLNEGAPSKKYGRLGEIEWTKIPSGVECVLDYGGSRFDDLGLSRVRLYKITAGRKSVFFDHEI